MKIDKIKKMERKKIGRRQKLFFSFFLVFFCFLTPKEEVIFFLWHKEIP